MRIEPTLHVSNNLYSMLIQESVLLSKLGYDVAAMCLANANNCDVLADTIELINCAIAELEVQQAPSWIGCHVTRWTYLVLKAKWEV